MDQVRALRDQLEAELRRRFPDILILGAGRRLPNTCCACFPA